MMRLRRPPLFTITASLALGGLAVSLAGPADTSPQPIAPVQCLRKMALDLTDRGPAGADISDLASGAATLGDLADRYMASPEFSDVVFNWYRQQFPPTDITPMGTDVEEPARIGQYIVLNDRDYRELVMGDYTVTADGTMQQIIERPAAGVIATTHYMSAYSGSFRRNWAGHFLKEWGGIVLEPVTLAPEDNRDLSPTSLLQDPSCAYCHGNPVSGVDHLAAFAACYEPNGARDPSCATEAGSFLTRSGSGLQELGAIVGQSKEFKSQAVNFFYQRLMGRQLAKQETELYLEAARTFTQSGYKPKALIRFLVTTNAYCAQ